jgi:UDP-glucose 4-epimerase
VLDLADAHVQALRYLMAGGDSQIINLGSEKGVSVFEMIEAVQKLTGKSVPYEVSARRPGDPAVLVASAAKARQVLGWSPKRGLDEIISDAWKWHSAHPKGYEDMG